MNNLTIAELKDLAKQHNVRIPSGYRKSEIVALLQTALPQPMQAMQAMLPMQPTTQPTPAMQATTNFANLPNDMLINILMNLTYPEIKNLCRTNKQMNYVCGNEYFWEQKYRQDFGKDKSLGSESWNDNYKIRYVEKRPKRFSQFGGVKMLTDNPDTFIKLITSIANSKYQANDPMAKVQTDLLIALGEVIYFNNRRRVKNYGEFLDNMKLLLHEYEPSGNYDIYHSRGSSVFLDYYITPEYLALELLKRKAEIYNGRSTVNITINTLTVGQGDRNHYKNILEFYNYVKDSGKILDHPSPIPTFEEVFDSQPHFDLNYIRSLIDLDRFSHTIFVDP